MRIAQIVPKLSWGGAERLALDLAKSHARAGHESHLVSLYATAEEALLAEGRASGLPLTFLGKRPGMDLRCARQLSRHLRDIRPDVIHTHLGAISYAAVAMRTMSVVAVHTFHAMANREATGARRSARRFALREFNAVAVSSAVGASVAKLYGIVPKVILNGVDRGRLMEGKPVSDSHREGGRPHLLFVGRLAEEKGVLDLVDAVRILRSRGIDLALDVVGSGDDDFVLGLLGSAAQEGILRLWGARGDVGRFIRGADVVVAPSHTEGYGLSIMEALTLGIPVVACQVDAVPEILGPEYGVDLVPPGDPGLLADAISILLHDVKLRRHLSAVGLRTSQTFSIEACQAHYEAYFEELQGHARYRDR